MRGPSFVCSWIHVKIWHRYQIQFMSICCFISRWVYGVMAFELWEKTTNNKHHIYIYIYKRSPEDIFVIHHSHTYARSNVCSTRQTEATKQLQVPRPIHKLVAHTSVAYKCRGTGSCVGCSVWCGPQTFDNMCVVCSHISAHTKAGKTSSHRSSLPVCTYIYVAYEHVTSS